MAAIPTGKQNSVAAQNPPSFVFVVARQSGLWSLANAFLKPVSPGPDGDLVQASVAALDDYWGVPSPLCRAPSLRSNADDGGLGFCKVVSPTLEPFHKQFLGTQGRAYLTCPVPLQTAHLTLPDPWHPSQVLLVGSS